MRISSAKFFIIIVVATLIITFSAGVYVVNIYSKSIALTPQNTVVTVDQNDIILALSNFNTSQGNFTWSIIRQGVDLRDAETVYTSHFNSLKFSANVTGEYIISTFFSSSRIHIQSNDVQVLVINKDSSLVIDSDFQVANLTSPIKFFALRVPYNDSNIVTGYEWFVNGTPLQQYIGSTATVLFHRAGIYSVYARAVLYNGTTIVSNTVEIPVVPSGFWNGSDMAGVGGYVNGPLFIHTPSNYSGYILWNGPGVYLPYGEYEVNFTMAISNTTGSGFPVVSLVVQGSVNSSFSIGSVKNIVRGDFPGPDEFTTFTIIFNQTFDMNVGFNFMGNSASTNLTIYLRSISVSPAGANNVQTGPNFTIEARSKSTNLTSPVSFSVANIPSTYKGLVSGYEWFVNGTPLQQYTGSAATVLFHRAGIYSVYASGVIEMVSMIQRPLTYQFNLVFSYLFWFSCLDNLLHTTLVPPEQQ